MAAPQRCGDPVAADEADSSPVADFPAGSASTFAGEERNLRSLEGWGGSGLKLVEDAVERPFCVHVFGLVRVLLMMFACSASVTADDTDDARAGVLLWAHFVARASLREADDARWVHFFVVWVMLALGVLLGLANEGQLGFCCRGRC